MLDVRALHDPRADRLERLYVVGDVHGRIDLLLDLEAAIRRDVRERPTARGGICYLGDYVDRGPHSFDVVEHLTSSADGGLPRFFLKGNHEDRLLAFLEDPAAHGAAWMRFGGREALASYGVMLAAEDEACDWTAVGAQFRRALPARHEAFFRGLRVGLAWRGFLFVHAGVNPDRPLDGQSERDLLWIREPFLSADRDYGLRVVHGHVVRPEPEFRFNRIGIDTGAYASGRLTALAVGADELRVLQTAPRAPPPPNDAAVASPET